MHPPALSIPGCPANVYGDAAMTNNSRWLWPFDPFQLPRSDSSLWVKVMMVPGDAVAVPKGWWHAVRSTPSSVAISVAVKLETVDECTVRRRACRRDAQPTPVVRGASDASLGSEQMLNSRRTDYAIGAHDPVAYYYALSDERLAESCSATYGRLEGRIITWHTGEDLVRFAEGAAADLGLDAQQANAVDAWMARFQQRPTQGGVVLVLADESTSETHGEATLTGEQREDARGLERLQDVQFQFSADTYTDEGELRVYTGCDAVARAGRAQTSGDAPATAQIADTV